MYLSYCCAGSFLNSFHGSNAVHLEPNSHNNSPCCFRILGVVFHYSHNPASLPGKHDICELLKGKVIQIDKIIS